MNEKGNKDKKDERKARSYKITDEDYKKAKDRRGALPLATLIEKFAQKYGNGNRKALEFAKYLSES